MNNKGEKGDLKNNIDFFNKKWSNYVRASKIHLRPNDEQVAILMQAMGEDCYKRFLNLPLEEADRTGRRQKQLQLT
jgi:hypothetical protein